MTASWWTWLWNVLASLLSVLLGSVCAAQLPGCSLAATTPHAVRIASSRCRDRFCRPCARDRAARVAHNLVAQLAGKPHRFVTLTLCSSDADLPDQLDRLYRSFRCLRRCRWWSVTVAGGVSFLEITRNPTTGQWHPHLHLIIEGSFLPQSQLSARWHEITGDSYIVHVRLVRDSSRDAHYVAKYLGNPFEAAVYRDPLALDQAMRAISGRRCMMTFGSVAEPPPQRPADPPRLASRRLVRAHPARRTCRQPASPRDRSPFTEEKPVEATPSSRTDAPRAPRPTSYRVLLPKPAWCPDCGVELGPETWSLANSSTLPYATCSPCSLRTGELRDYLTALVLSPTHNRHFTRAAGILWFTPKTRQPHTLHAIDTALAQGKVFP